jgi:hypothetical protein
VSAEDGPVEFRMPDELRVGVYANLASFWFSEHEFTLDWAALDHRAGESVAAVCARVRIPVSLIFDVLRALNEVMTNYERIFGEIRRPGE